MQEVWGGNEMNDSGEEGTPAASLGAPERGREGRAFGGRREAVGRPPTQSTHFTAVLLTYFPATAGRQGDKVEHIPLPNKGGPGAKSMRHLAAAPEARSGSAGRKWKTLMRNT